MDRRSFAIGTTAAILAAAGAPTARGQDGLVRIGFQKYGTLVLLKGRGGLEARLASLGYQVSWSEFPAGPQLLEALATGAIDLGSTGEAPPIFAQAAGAAIVYAAHEPPAPRGEAILVPADSPLRTVAELRGRTVALNKGSNVHYLLARALDQAGVAYKDVRTVFLPPADARAAFEQGAVDAWAIWDPFQAAAEQATSARTLSNGEGIVANYQFYLGDRTFVEAHPDAVDAVLAGLDEVDRWASSNPAAAAAQLAPSVGIPAPILTTALQRQSYGVTPLTDQVIADQQKVADTFHALGLIPQPIRIADAIRRRGA